MAGIVDSVLRHINNISRGVQSLYGALNRAPNKHFKKKSNFQPSRAELLTPPALKRKPTQREKEAYERKRASELFRTDLTRAPYPEARPKPSPTTRGRPYPRKNNPFAAPVAPAPAPAPAEPAKTPKKSGKPVKVKKAAPSPAPAPAPAPKKPTKKVAPAPAPAPKPAKPKTPKKSPVKSEWTISDDEFLID